MLPGTTKGPEESTLAVGSIPGHYQTDDDGVASYRMPIWAPAAYGEAPSLALAYRSDAGDGAVGVGFSLEGISSIRPCPHNLSDDGENEPPTLGPSDKLCLDGRRLVLVSGTYGQEAEYRTTPDTHARIRSEVRAPGQPPRFTVWTKDRKVAIFEPKQILTFPDGSEHVRSWGVTSTRDEAGHETRYTYAALKRTSHAGRTYDAEVVLDRITYGHSALSIAPAYEIAFSYGGRPDPRKLYTHGFALELNSRLEQITVRTATGTELRRYSLGYETAGTTTSRSRLGSVEMCAGTTCMRPTSFGWTLARAGVDTASPIKSESLLEDSGLPYVGDFDGDGRSDFARRNLAVLTHQDTPGGVYPPAVPSAGFGTETVAVDYDLDGRTDLLFRSTAADHPLLVTRYKNGQLVTEDTGLGDLRRLQAFDLNGDGRRDLVGCNGTEWVARLQLPGGKYGADQVISVMPAGVEDPCDVDLVGLDADGDGDTDLLATHPPNPSDAPEAVVIRLTASGFVAQPTGMTDRLSRFKFFTARVLDINGDGLHDLVAFDSAAPLPDAKEEYDVNRSRVWLNTGAGFRVLGTLPITAGESYNVGSVMDWNGDGREDLFFSAPVSTRVDAPLPAQRVLLSRGDGTWEAAETGLEYGATQVLDANGDGQPDLLRINKIFFCIYDKEKCTKGVTTRYSWQVFLHRSATTGDGEATNQPPDRVVEIRDGAHQSSTAEPSVRIAYGALTDRAGWDKAGAGEGAGSPTEEPLFRRCWDAGSREGCFAGARFVVAEEVHDAGATGLPLSRSITRHQYEEARYDRDGRGDIGFHWHKLRTWHTDALPIDGVMSDSVSSSVVRELDQSFMPSLGRYPWAGQVKREVVTVPLEGGASRETWRSNKWDAQPTAAGNFFPYVGIQRSMESHLAPTPGGALAATVLSHMETARIVDVFGNTVSETSRAFLDATPFAGTADTTTVVRVVENDTTGDRWLLGLIKSETRATDGEPALTTTYEHDDVGRIRKETSEPGHPTRQLDVNITRDVHGNVTSVVSVGATGGTRRTCTTYTPDGLRPFAQTNALGHTTTFRFGLAGEPLSMRDPNGRETLTAYDAFLRPVVEVAPGNVITTREVRYLDPDKDSFTTLVQRNNGARSLTIHDRFGRALTELGYAVKDNEGRLASRGLRFFDNRGRVTTAYHPQLDGEAPQADTFTYANDGRLVKRTNADGAITHFAAEWPSLTEAVTQVTETFTRTTRTTRDRRGRVVAVKDTMGGVTSYAYKPSGALTSVTGPDGVTTTTETDPWGRPVALHDPSSGLTTTDYDAYGQVVRTATADGAIATTTYDAGGRVRAHADEDGLTRFLYDPPGALGALRRSESADGVNRTYTYDAAGRIHVERVEADGELYAVKYGYDATSQVERVEYPAVGGVPFVLRYGRDPYAHVTRIVKEEPGGVSKPIWWKLSETAAGQTQDELFGNGTGTRRLYEPQTQRLAGILSVRPTPADPRQSALIQALGYGYYKVGTLKTRTDYLQGPGADAQAGTPGVTGETERFVYDDLDRLLSAKLDSADVARYAYAYDPGGSFVTKSDVGAYAYDAARPHVVASAGALTYAHDARGRMTQRGLDALAYTASNKVRSITTGGKATHYRYDASAGRVVTEDGATHTVRLGGLYERRVTKASLKGAASVRHRYFVASPERTIAVAEMSTSLAGAPLGRGGLAFTYVHTDHLGSPDVLTNESGEVVERQSFDPFGGRRDPRWTSTATPKAPRLSEGFTGHEDDPAGLVNAQGRSYDPRLGRFVSPDPFVQAPLHSPSLHRYAYVWNSPMNMVDPSGYNGAPTGSVLIQADDGSSLGYGIEGGCIGPCGGAPKSEAPSTKPPDAPSAQPDSHRSDNPGTAGDTASVVVSAASDAFVGNIASIGHGTAAAGRFAYDHPVLAVGASVGGALTLPFWTMGAAAYGYYTTYEGAEKAYKRGGAAALGGHIAGEILAILALNEVGKGASAVGRAAADAAARAVPLLKSIATMPAFAMLGMGAGGGRIPASAFGARVAEAGRGLTASGKVIRNMHLAGRSHPVTGVPFDRNGFPDFSAWRHPNVADVRIELSGSRSTDFSRANAMAGLSETPSNYTWHHHQDSGLMQLIDRVIHAKTGHTGGFLADQGGHKMTSFFEDDAYFTGPDLTPAMVQSAEKVLGFSLPRAYLDILRERNGGKPRRRCFRTPRPTSWAPDHVELLGLRGIGGTWGIDTTEGLGSADMIREWGYPKIGVVLCEMPSGGHDAIMLDYSAVGPAGEPSVVYIDEDRSILALARSFREFIDALEACSREARGG